MRTQEDRTLRQTAGLCAAPREGGKRYAEVVLHLLAALRRLLDAVNTKRKKVKERSINI